MTPSPANSDVSLRRRRYLNRYDNIAGGNPASKGVDNLCRPSLAANPTCAPPKPLISHEMGNFGVFPNLTASIADLNASLNLRASDTNHRLHQSESSHPTCQLFFPVNKAEDSL